MAMAGIFVVALALVEIVVSRIGQAAARSRWFRRAGQVKSGRRARVTGASVHHQLRTVPAVDKV